MSDKLLLLKAIYTNFYQEKSEETVGIYTSETMVDRAIQSYKERKIRYNAECLLDNTEFKVDYITLNEIPK
jgi:hypothetical protein